MSLLLLLSHFSNHYNFISFKERQEVTVLLFLIHYFYGFINILYGMAGTCKKKERAPKSLPWLFTLSSN